MQGFYTPAQLAEMLGGGESTYRQKAANGVYKHAVKQGNTWFIPLLDVAGVGRGYDKEFAEPLRLSVDRPDDTKDIVIAQDDDGRYGIYLEDHWYGAGQALRMLQYLEQHKNWLEEKAKENNAMSHIQVIIKASMRESDHPVWAEIRRSGSSMSYLKDPKNQMGLSKEQEQAYLRAYQLVKDGDISAAKLELEKCFDWVKVEQ
jgi:hypothetical protein